jgi:hypothetical protein
VVSARDLKPRKADGADGLVGEARHDVITDEGREVPADATTETAAASSIVAKRSRSPASGT